MQKWLENVCLNKSFCVHSKQWLRVYTKFGSPWILVKYLTAWVVMTLSNIHKVAGSNATKCHLLFKKHTPSSHLKPFTYSVAISASTRWGTNWSNVYMMPQNCMAERSVAVSPLQGVRVQILPGCSLVGVGCRRQSNPLSGGNTSDSLLEGWGLVG